MATKQAGHQEVDTFEEENVMHETLIESDEKEIQLVCDEPFLLDTNEHLLYCFIHVSHNKTTNFKQMIRKVISFW